MKYSFNWLKELSGTKKSAEQVAELLTMHSFEVESIEKLGQGLDGIVAGEILETKKHPNADNLHIAKVSIGNKTKQVIFGGKAEIKSGNKVPVAVAPTELPGGNKIEKIKLRGELSEGMLCLSSELGLSKSAGIIYFDKKIKPGTKIKKVLGLDDTVIDIDILANRGHDALSHIGIAGEIAALEGRKLAPLNPPRAVFATGKKFNGVKIRVQDKKLCPRYIGVVMENVKVQESPQWIKSKLVASGINPINNVVDVTNYVLLELGQPMHAFDMSKLKSQKSKAEIIVRKAKKGEKIKLLDETEKELAGEDLVIADGQKPIALAGVMGGLDTGVTEISTEIILECANFNPQSVRKTRIRHNLVTESSDRFEKGIDPNMAEIGMARAVELLEKMGGKFAGAVDIYPSKLKPWKIKLNLDYVNKLLGEEIPAATVKKILNSLEIDVSGSGNILTATIPTFRLDLENQEDLIEEIGRIYGYEKIEASAPNVSVTMPPTNESRKFERVIKQILTGSGLSEVYNYSFYSQRDASHADLASIKHLELSLIHI